jgi:hypothetical protein
MMQEVVPTEWYPNWEGKTAAIIASGPSTKTIPLDLLKDRSVHSIVINTSVRLAPWAEVLYACDGKWWRLNNGIRGFTGLKVTQDTDAVDLYPEIKLIKVIRHSDELILKHGYVGGGANSGFQALNLVVQWGAKRILLIGYDMRLDLGSH